MFEGEPLYLDVETTNLDKGDCNNLDNRLLLACWEYKGKMYSCYENEYNQQLLLEHIEECDFIVAHNAKFELGWLARCGYVLGSKPTFCTMLACYAISGNRRHKLSLNACCERYGLGSKETLIDRFIRLGVCPSDLPSRWLVQYCKQDVWLCKELYNNVKKICEDSGILSTVRSRCCVSDALTSIESNGMCLDAVKVEKLYKTTSDTHRVLERRLETLTKGINVNSNPQLIKYLYEDLGFNIPKQPNGKPYLTPGGDPQVTTAALAALKPTTKAQREFLVIQKEFNECNSLLSKYLTKLQSCCEHEGGILRATYNQAISKTHRLTSSGKKYKIQLQNLPRDFKPLFRAREEDWLIMEADFSQLEFRIAVDLARDEQGYKDIGEGFDIHAFSASVLFDGWASSKGKRRKDLRTAAKAETFRPLFGGSAGNKRQKAYYAAFRERYPQLAALQAGWVEEVLDTGELKLVTGAKAYWEDTAVTRTGYITNTTMIYNYQVQRFASAEVVLLSLYLIWKEMQDRGLQSIICNTVHDSIIFEVHPEEVEELTKLVKHVMERRVVEHIEDLYGYEIIVPLACDIEVASHWGI